MQIGTRALAFQVRSEASHCELVTHAHGMEMEELIGVRGFVESMQSCGGYWFVQ